jgi:hypothetical protein
VKRTRTFGSLGGALLIASFAVLVLSSGAWAASQFKTLHKFSAAARMEAALGAA